MATGLTFEYDETGDILYIQTVAPYAAQTSEQAEYNVVVRRNPRTRVVEVVEVLFFTRWLLKHGQPQVRNLTELFARPAA